MGRVCDITGRGTQRGLKVSHANNRTKRTYKINLKKRKFYLPKEDEWIELRVSTRAIKSIDKNGIYAYLQTHSI